MPVASSHPHPEVKEALAFLRSIDPWVLERQMELTAIPAPPFQEKARGDRMGELFGETGLQNILTDERGNVHGEFHPGEYQSPEADSRGGLFILSAHLDTVFPDGTEVTPTREGDRIRAPGISDDGRGLAALLALARVLTAGHAPPPPYPVLFVATVGEEGPGNLRGVQHLFADRSGASRARGFISLDGAGMGRIIHRAVGSTRLRLVVKGSGGHSWTDFGRPNPIHALGRIVARVQTLVLPSDPRATLTIARWGGGTSINSIPQEAWVEVDLRSEDGSILERLEGDLLGICDEVTRGGSDATDPHHELRAHGLSLEVQEIGRRPSGSTDPSHPLVRAAMEATRFLGEEPLLISSSTDANVPMSLGIPAITMGAGGTGGGVHTLDEWYLNQKGPEGILRALLTLLLYI